MTEIIYIADPKILAIPIEECGEPLIDESVRKNRELLLSVMVGQGFVNYPTEWWHFSYGDRYWAYHTKHSHAIFGSVSWHHQNDQNSVIVCSQNRCYIQHQNKTF